MTTYDLQMFNNTDVPVVEHLCMASIFFLPLTSSVQQHFGVRLPCTLRSLHLALLVELLAAAAITTIGEVGLAMDFDSSDAT